MNLIENAGFGIFFLTSMASVQRSKNRIIPNLVAPEAGLPIQPPISIAGLAAL